MELIKKITKSRTRILWAFMVVPTLFLFFGTGIITAFLVAKATENDPDVQISGSDESMERFGLIFLIFVLGTILHYIILAELGMI